METVIKIYRRRQYFWVFLRFFHSISIQISFTGKKNLSSEQRVFFGVGKSDSTQKSAIFSQKFYPCGFKILSFGFLNF